MAILLYTLSLISGGYEMLILMLAFREFLTWRLATVWVSGVVLFGILGQLATAWWPHLPLVFIWIIPITLFDTWLSARLLYSKWILMLPIVLFLNALKRLIGGVAGSFLKFALASDLAKPLRQATNLHNVAADINLFGAVVICLPIMILIGLGAHHLVKRTTAADFFQHVSIETSDYWLVLLCYAGYILAYAYVLDFTVVSQTYVASIACLVFGIITFYLVSNKNSRLTDAQLLNEVSQYNAVLSHHNQQLHLFKHDYQNILLSMAQYIQHDDMPGLKTYFEQAVWPNSQELNIGDSPAQLRYLKAPAVSGLIYSKFEAAAAQQVTLAITALQPIQLPAVNQVNVVRILGNLLDNAIDAASQANHQVQLAIVVTPQQAVRFQVKNQIPATTTIDLQRISKNRFTTKPGHFGYGLSSIAQLTNKQVKVSYEVTADQFEATLLIQAQPTLRKS
ncbi:sensor histidine kinase [Lactiplantibacillus fabifermentans]|uniref:Sensor histidine protein kinase n=2 Tax=Lactiplantibacillus fabifermentans TaxID=483011 RepID=A0A0R2NT69_9LACO|nr:GHKL domain-containing protein [Lactiplantibacillus fabifermentans]ETY73403.1 histidine kinase [Lactiplantibacillus fabifermentans T30PCM01]KRO27931.1 sensor histidine protein kinase [Lactiplantibacillus fabifermentans DSM 21115]